MELIRKRCSLARCHILFVSLLCIYSLEAASTILTTMGQRFVVISERDSTDLKNFLLILPFAIQMHVNLSDDSH